MKILPAVAILRKGLAFFAGMKVFFAILFIISLAICHAQCVTFSPLRNFTTETKFPPEVHIQHSNNNLDLIDYHKRYYLGFRTAPTHFASSKTWLYVVSSSDQKNWAFEDSIHMGYDMREPRFYEYHDTLFMVFFRGGKKMLRFEPYEMLMTYKAPGKAWTQPASTGLDGYVPWRVRTRRDTLYLSAYYGRHLYKHSHHADLRLFTSTDGFRWHKLSADPQVNLESAEEGEFIFDVKGDMYGVVRLEGTGSLLTYASHDSLDKWHIIPSHYKYDSSLLLASGDDIYLLARRSLAGEMTKAPKWMNPRQARNYNLFRYIFSRKVTAIFRYDKVNKTLVHILDFPSTGDTAFPAVASLSQGKFLFMNYSSNILGVKKNWIRGQLGKTYIYSTVMQIDK
jgi:hypothetical protein